MSKITGLHTKPNMSPIVQRISTAGSGTWNRSYYFQIAPGSATIGATYTNNGVTFTIYNTVSGATQVVATGSGAPTSGGVLTKASGAGDATLTFVAFFKATSLLVRLSGGGAGGGGAGVAATTGTTGNQSLFGSSLLTAPGAGPGGQAAGAGGSASNAPTVSAPAVALRILIGSGGSPTTGNSSNAGGGDGGMNYLGGRGSGGVSGIQSAQNAPVNCGGGGGGAFLSAASAAGGGGAGSYLEAIIYGADIAATYSYTVAARANGGTGTNGGGSGSEGLLETVEEFD